MSLSLQIIFGVIGLIVFFAMIYYIAKAYDKIERLEKLISNLEKQIKTSKEVKGKSPS